MTATAKLQKEFNPKKYARLLAETLPKEIESEEEYDRMLDRINKFMSMPEEKITPEIDALVNLLTTLVEAYEDKHHSIEPLPPLEFLKALMEDRGIRQKDLMPVFGSSGIASEVLHGKRAISKTHAKKLAAFFNLSVEHFI